MMLPPPSALPYDFKAEIADAAALMQDVTVRIYDESKGTVVPYDAVTDTGGYTVGVLVLESKAEMVTHGMPRNVMAGSEWVTKKAVRFRLPLNSAFIHKGMIIRIINSGARNPQSLGIAFTIISCINNAVCTIETVSDMSAVPVMI